MRTTVGIKIYPSPTWGFGASNSTVHELTVTRTDKTSAIAAAIAELIKMGGPELQTDLALAQRLLPILIRTTREARAANILKDVNPA